MKYRLEVSEEQAEIIEMALKEYFDIRMNMTGEFANSICFEGIDPKNCTGDDLNERIRKRDLLREGLRHLLDYVHPMVISERYLREPTIETKRAQDIWAVIKYRLWIDRHGNEITWSVEAPKPMTGEPLPKMEAIGEMRNE